MSEDAKDFIQRSLYKSVSRRPSIHEMLRHDWVEGFSNRARRSMKATSSTANATLQSAPSAGSHPALLPPAAASASTTHQLQQRKELQQQLPVASASNSVSKPLFGASSPSAARLTPTALVGQQQQQLPPHLASVMSAICEDRTPGAVQRALQQYQQQRKAALAASSASAASVVVPSTSSTLPSTIERLSPGTRLSAALSQQSGDGSSVCIMNVVSGADFKGARR